MAESSKASTREYMRWPIIEYLRQVTRNQSQNNASNSHAGDAIQRRLPNAGFHVAAAGGESLYDGAAVELLLVETFRNLKAVQLFVDRAARGWASN